MTKVIDVCLVGAAGRMGQEILRQMKTSDKVRLSGAIVSRTSKLVDVSVDCSTCGHISFSNDLTKYALASDVIVDFSTSEATDNVINTAFELAKPVVCGVTGISEDTANLMKEVSSSIPILYSPNMSIGISAMLKAIKVLSMALDFDIEVNEIHHSKKRDVPSGTALLLAETAAKARCWSSSETLFFRQRNNYNESSKNKKIGLSSVRGGNNAGTHTVYFLGDEESVEVIHRTESKSVFANGAIVAAKWICSQKSGMYSMVDLVESCNFDL
ncbi:MAG: 4-hydroxy-tetrahydrodipicolinate reductase [Holosporales bacterium]|jgi:4-hydroxy-tetrahydrodipicolinate reductase|nr:4-hydroxy-tetrahydrodipicolinate reductase [Holosporales bacterium]